MAKRIITTENLEEDMKIENAPSPQDSVEDVLKAALKQMISL